MRPPQQGFGAHQCFVARAKQRLVMQRQAVAAFQLGAQRLLDRLAAHHGLVHRRVKAHAAVLAQLLGAVHRRVCVADQGIHVRSVVGKGRNAGAARHVHLLTGFGIGELKDADDPLAVLTQGLVIHVLAQDHGEFIATHARDAVAAAHHRLQAAGHLAQQPVARCVAEGVVERLEVVQVDVHQSHPLVRAACQFKLCGQPLVEGMAVVHAGDGIGMGQLLQAVFGLAHHCAAAQHNGRGQCHHTGGDERSAQKAKAQALVHSLHRLAHVQGAHFGIRAVDGVRDLQHGPPGALGNAVHARGAQGGGEVGVARAGVVCKQHAVAVIHTGTEHHGR